MYNESNQFDAKYNPYGISNVAEEPSFDVVPVNYGGTMKVTSFNDLLKYKEGSVVRLPDFAEGQPFVVRMRRPSLLVLAKSGKIPNALMKTASELFKGEVGQKNKDDENMLSDLYNVCEIIADASLIEPSYEDIKKAGLILSDDQLLAIFNYSQTGVKALDNFRFE